MYRRGLRTTLSMAHWLSMERTATVEGKVEDDGRIVANIKGPNVTCTAVSIPINKAPGGSRDAR